MDSTFLRKVKLAHLPTPLEEMSRLSTFLDGPRLFIKRDDATGLAFGGNKTRMLEYLMSEALDAEADAVLTGAGLQSNWCRQVAAAARKFGLIPVLVLRTGHWKKVPKIYDGNLLIDKILGADIRIIKHGITNWQEKKESVFPSIIKEYESKGMKVHVLGGYRAVSSLSAVAYYDAVKEILDQASKIGLNFDKIVCPITSGGTCAGLSIGFKTFNPSTQVLAINVGSSDEESLTERVLEYGNGAAELIGCRERISKEDFNILSEYACGGYGLMEQKLVEVIKEVAQLEGIILDPVYTGKAMLGIFEMIKEGNMTKNQSILFLHTGGTPALFPYKEYFQ